ncbi:MAG: S8 family serine peptidase [Pirellulaceae bacterium]
MAKRQVIPTTFFLNEKHELTASENRGGGRLPQYEGISWGARASRISQSLRSVAEKVEESNDPLKDDRYFVLAVPVRELKKRSENKKRAPQGTYEEPTDFGSTHGKVFDRLGLDLLQVTDDGKAVVHAEREKLAQLVRRTESLDDLGQREQARWATIDSFETVPLELRIDARWLQRLRSDDLTDMVIELQPVLSRGDADRVLRAIADFLVQQQGQKLTGTGTDFSGRHWFKGQATRRSIRYIAKDFFSVQSIHAPLYSIAAVKISGRPGRGKIRQELAPPTPADLSSLPCVAVVDLGIPDNHVRLGPYRRGQFYPQNAPRGAVGDHGSIVASRVVFGDCGSPDELERATGRCTFFDAVVGEHPQVNPHNNRVNDKIVMEAIRGVSGASPDVRVFNLSIGSRLPLNGLPAVEKRERRVLLQDLDNFCFANDCIVIVAAGNSQLGVPPNDTYPDHHADGRWALGGWASGFNTLVCGSFVSRLSTNGLVQTVGWPSSFTRVGPGLCDSPVPSFSAEGGDWDETYNFRPGLGVWAFSAVGRPEDHAGTSLAAPILAREAALTLHEMQKHCAPGTQPFAVTARAFLTLTADRPVGDSEVRALVERTLGSGKASSRRLITPAAGSAVILWQGYVDSPRDTVRVQLPIPLEWLAQAESPVLRLVVCSDPPVNEVARGGWACRKVKPILHLGPDAPSVRAPRGAHPTYSVINRQYALDRYKPGLAKAAESDLWLLEISYEEISSYPAATDFDPRQRVAFAAELVDTGAAAVDPQAAMQAVPIAATMNRLSIQPTPIRSPIIVKTRV